MCVGTVLCVANTKGRLFQYSVMCSGGWKRSRVHPIKRLPLVCVWFWVTMGTMEPGWQWRPLVTTGRMHSACPVNPSQVPTSECFLIPRGSLKQQAEAGGGLGDSLRWFLQGGSRWVLVVGGYVGYFVPQLIYTYICCIRVRSCSKLLLCSRQLGTWTFSNSYSKKRDTKLNFLLPT